MDPILRSLGYTKGTVGERMQALGKDPRYLFPEGDKGRAEIMAFIQERLKIILSEVKSRVNEGASLADALAVLGALDEDVGDGKGVVGFHAATDSSYQWKEYGKMMGGILTLDFGDSLTYPGQSVNSILLRTLPVSAAVVPATLSCGSL